MACLYIDRLKSNFQRAHHFSQRANNGEICWCPRSSIDRFCNYKCERTPEATTNISVSVKFNPAAPKIFTIGLQPNYQHTSNDYFSVIAITALFKQYLAYLLQRYRSYFRSSSKLASNKSCNLNMCSLNSLVSVVSKCSNEFTKNILDTSRGSNHGTLRRCKHHKSPNEKSQNVQTSSENITRPDIPDEQFVEHRQDSQQARQKMYRHSGEHENEDVRSRALIRSTSRTERVVDRAVSSDRSNASRDVYSNYDGSPVPVAMRSICVQTSRNTKSRRKERRKKRRESNRKENSVLASTEVPSSQGIRTIFRSNSKDFNREESDLNLDLLETRRKKTSNMFPDVKGNFGRKQHSKSKENDDFTMIYQKCTERRRSVSTKIQRMLTNKLYNNSPPLSGREDVFLANSIETVCDSVSLHEIVNVSQTSRDYSLEDKSSETIILGNIKKRLEEDYDDYFSFDEFDVFETWPKLTPKMNRTSSDSTIDYYACDQNSETATPLMRTESLSKYQRPNHSEHNFSMKSTNRRNESLQTNLTYSFSIHCTNSNLSHSQSSYYTPSQQLDVSPCSSVEYCSARNNSSSNFSRNAPNFNLLATLPPNTAIACNRALETSPLSIRSPDRGRSDVSSKSNEIFPRRSESIIRRHRSSSTKNFSNLITESFDSGVLTDYSRDHLLSSSERSGRTRGRCCAREPSSLPTYDFNSDSSYSDDSLNRRLEVAVKKFTENLVLTERKVRLKLRRLENPSRTRQYRRRRPRRQQVQKSSICNAEHDSLCKFYWSHDDEKFAGSSTPPILSLSDSEIDHI